MMRSTALEPSADAIRSREPGAGSREPGAGSREPGAGSRAGSREPGAGSREPGAGSREPGAGSRDCVRGPDGALHHAHRHRHAPDRAADAMGRAVCARRERPSRLSLRPRRPAGPASPPSFPGFLSRLSRTAARLALAALLLAGAGTVAAPASADVLVSNIGKSTTSTTTDLADLDAGQRFTTGSHTAGYDLTSVEVKFSSTPSGLTVTLLSSTLTTVATLSNPATPSSGNNTFTAPSGTTLSATTDYWLLVEASEGSLSTTNSNDEDGATGWSVWNFSATRDDDATGSFGTSNLYSYLIRVNGTAKSSTNTAPTASDGEVETLEDEAYTFAHGDFNFSDTDSDDTELASVKVVTLPGSGKGTLKFDGTALASGDLEKTVTKAELDADKLTYEPPADANGNDYTTFTFKVNDGDDDSADTYTMTIDVNRVPEVTAVAVTSTPQSGSSPKKYGAGEKIQVTVTFDTQVAVRNDPHVELQVGTNARDADYASGSGSKALVFEYTVVAADADSDGIAVNADVKLDTDPGSVDAIVDDDYNNFDADVTFTALGAQSDHKVDGNLTPPATDNTAPTVSSAVVTAAKPKELVVTFSEALATGSVPAKTAFAVKVGGSAGPAVSTVAIDGARVKLGLAVALDAGQTSVTVDYTNPGTANDPLKDAADNEVTTFSNQAVVNNAPACPSGQPASAFWTACLTVGKNTFATNTWGYSSLAGALSDRDFNDKGTAQVVDGLYNYDTGELQLVIRLDLYSPREMVLQVGATSLNLPSGSNIFNWTSPGFAWTDANIGDKVSVSLRLKADADITAPTLQSATVRGAELVLTFDEALHDEAETTAASAFTVKVGGTAVDLEDPANADPVVHDGATITLTLAAAVDPADTVTVTYTRPGSVNDMIRDLSGNRAASFTDQAVEHRRQPAAAIKPNEIINNVPDRVRANEGGTGRYGIKMREAVEQNVTISVTSEDPDAVSVSPSSVVFTPANWNDFQQITVRGESDDDGLDEQVHILHEGGGSPIRTVLVKIRDNDRHEQDKHSLIYSNNVCHCLFVQAGTEKTFTVRPAFQPEGDVTILWDVYNYFGGVSGTGSNVTGPSSYIKYAGIKVSPRTITFTRDNWETPQTFTVLADTTYNHVDPKTKVVDEDRSTTGVVMGLKPWWEQKTYPYTQSPDFRITVGSGREFAKIIPSAYEIAAEPGSQSARLTWALHEDDTDEDLSRWKVRHGEADDAGEVSDWGDWSTIPGSQRDTRSHVVTGLANGTRYGFQVMPVAGDTDGFESATATATPEAGLTLSAPGRTDLFVDGGDAQATLSWNGLSFGGTVTGWQYRYGEHNRDNGHTAWLDWTDIGDAAATSHTVTDLVNDRDYAFQVRAMAGENPGDMSEVQTAYVYHPLIERFVAAQVTDTSVGVEWGLPEGSQVTALRARYRVPEGEWQSEELALDATGHTFTGLDPETRYNFQVVLESATGGTETGILVQATNSDSSVITGFTLVNASTDADIGALGASVTATRNGVYGIRAEVAPNADIGSIVMQLSGEVAHSQTESVAPYSLYGDRNNREHGRALDEGTYTISATAYAEPRGQGDVIGTRALTFTVAVEAAPSTPVLTGFTLLDASDQSTVAALSDGAEIDLGGRSGGSFGIRADVASDATVGSVALSLTGAKAVSRTENLAPYSLYGDHRDGNGGRSLDGASLPAGTYTLSATAYAQPRASGTVRGTLSVSFEVLAPAALSVADAEAEEGTDATLDFAVTLNREAAGTVTVGYATENGTATAGSDYTATSGTLTFAPGETEKTVSVPVLEDDHDEGSETLTLRLTSASGATIADGEATGTITNSDAIPQAWLARFGRTVTGQVLDAVEARLASPREAGAQASLAGQALPSWRGGDGAAAANDDGEAAVAAAREEAEARAGLASMTGWLSQMEPGSGTDGAGAGTGGLEPQSRALTQRDFIAGTSFALTGGSKEGGGFGSLWGRASIAGFDGREGALTVDGEVTTGLIGADWSSDPGSGTGAGRWTAGLAIGHSTGTGGWRRGGACDLNCAGAIEAVLTGLYPYAGIDLTERLSVWAAAGYGAGEVTVTPEGRPGLTADLTLSMGAAGLRSEVLRPVDANGLSLAVKGDARFTRTSSDAVRSDTGNLAAAEADVWLLRTGVEGSRPVVLGEGGASLTPSFEVGLRLDGGDAESGFGADLGGGLAFADSENGLSLDMKARGLVAHEASGFREWGASVSGAWDPRPRTDRGLSLSLTQSWGASPSGGMDALLSRETLAGLAANDDGAGRFEASSRLEGELGYGLPAFGGGFTGTPNLGFGLSEHARDWRIGWRLTPARAGAGGFEVSLDATRSEPANDDARPEHGVMLRGAVRW